MRITLNMSRWRIAGTLWLLLIPLCSPAKTSDLLIHTHAGVQSFKVTTATSQDAQLTGLHGWNSLAADEGMLFIFQKMTQRPFWTKHISIPLDILFIDSSGKVVDIIEHAEPGAETPLVARSPFPRNPGSKFRHSSQDGYKRGRSCVSSVDPAQR